MAPTYVTTGCKFSHSSLTYRLANATDSAAWDTMFAQWATTDLNFTRVTSGTTHVFAQSYYFSGVTWDGLAQLTCSSGTTTQATVSLNRAYTDGYSTYKRRSVAGHEIGHAIGLAHRSGCHLMNGVTATRWDSCGIWTLTLDERNGANALY